jgi:periplasmic protein TonB
MHSAVCFTPPSRDVLKENVQSRREQPGDDASMEFTAIEGAEAFRQKAVKILLVASLHIGLFAWLAQVDSGQREVHSPVRLDVRTISVPSAILAAGPENQSSNAKETKIATQVAKPAAPRIKQPVPPKQLKHQAPSTPLKFSKPTQEGLSTASSDAAFSLSAQAAQKTMDGTGKAGESALPASAASSVSGPSGATSAARFDADYLSNPAPAYPAASRRMREEGTVYLEVNVTAEGRAGELGVRKSSGYVRLDEAALDTVRHWRFVPARRGAEAIAAQVVVPVVFRLGG